MISSRGIVSDTSCETVRINDLEVCLEGGCEHRPGKPDSKNKIKTAIYKSLLQKSVRRMNLEEGLRACAWLWVNDQTALFRRISIISVEDGYYNSEDNHMWMWMMLLNGKGYVISGEDLRERMMDSVRRLILHPCYSRNRETVPGGSSIDLSDKLFPLKIRRQYGGMVGDMIMLEKFIEEYNPVERYSELPLAKPSEGRLYEACDFHVFPWLVKEENMKSVVWKYRSGVNVRDRSSMTPPPKSLETYLAKYDAACINLYNEYL
jgi:hypothetical protein